MNVEKILIQYATYNWKGVLITVKDLFINNLTLFAFIFLILYILWLKRSKRETKVLSKETQTEIIIALENLNDKNFLLDFLQLERICLYMINFWIQNFKKLQESNIISKSFQIVSFNPDTYQHFHYSDIDYKISFDIITLSFRLKCSQLNLSATILFSEEKSTNIVLNIVDLEIKYKMLIQVKLKEISVKFCPEAIINFEASIVHSSLSESEKELRTIEFDRDFRLVLLQQIDLSWISSDIITETKERIKSLARSDQECQVESFLDDFPYDDDEEEDDEDEEEEEEDADDNEDDDGDDGEDKDEDEELLDTVVDSDSEEDTTTSTSGNAELIKYQQFFGHDISQHEKESKTINPLLELTPSNITVSELSKSKDTDDINTPQPVLFGHRANSDISLFTSQSFWFNKNAGEASPFHDRFANQLTGRTLVVTLVKLVDVQELKGPCKRGYCVLELNEPYQRQISHLIPLVDSPPIWNQHFVFSLNSNSQRLSVKLFNSSKKGHHVSLLGVCTVTMSQILIDQNQNFYPINTHVHDSCSSTLTNRDSWRCDEVPGGENSRIPAFEIEFKLMVSANGAVPQLNTPPKFRIQYSASRLSDTTQPNKTKKDKCVSPELSNQSSEATGRSISAVKGAQPIETQLDNGLVSVDKKSENVETKKEQRVVKKGVVLRSKTTLRPDNSSVMRKLKYRLSNLPLPWVGGIEGKRSHSDDYIDGNHGKGSKVGGGSATAATTNTNTTNSNSNVTAPTGTSEGITAGTTADSVNTDIKYTHGNHSSQQLQQHHQKQFPIEKHKATVLPEVDLKQSKSLSNSLKKLLHVSHKRSKFDPKDKSFEELFKEMDPKGFDTISSEGFDRIMNS